MTSLCHYVKGHVLPRQFPLAPCAGAETTRQGHEPKPGLPTSTHSGSVANRSGRLQPLRIALSNPSPKRLGAAKRQGLPEVRQGVVLDLIRRDGAVYPRAACAPAT